MKRLKKIALFSLILVASLVSLSLILTSVYEEEVEAFALEKVQESLLTEFTVGEADLSIWKKFPQTSLLLEDIYIQETFESQDTLLYAKEVYLEFGLLDLFSGKYAVDGISVEGAKLHLKWAEDQSDNFHFWKESDGSNESFEFAVEKITLKDTEYTMNHRPGEFQLSSYIDYLAAGGNFKERVFDLSLEGDMVVHNVDVSDNHYANDNSLEVNLGLTINTETDQYLFKKGSLNIDGLDLATKGSVSLHDEGTYCALEFTGENLDSENILAVIPKAYAEKMVDYRIEGTVDGHCEVKGYANADSAPKVTIEYALKDVDFTHFESGLQISEMIGSGVFQKEYNHPERIDIHSLSADFEDGKFLVQGHVSNLVQPQFDLKMVGNFDLSDFQRFTGIETMEHARGHISFDSKFAGKLTNLTDLKSEEIKAIECLAQISLEDAVLKFRNSPLLFENIQAKLSIENQHTDVKGFQCDVENSAFQLEGSAKNLVPYILLPDEKLDVNAYFTSEYLDFNTLLSNEKSQSEQDEYALHFPDDVDFSFQFAVDKFNFREFTGEKLKGKANMDAQVLTVSPVEINNSKGRLRGNLTMDGRNENVFLLSSSAEIVDIDIHELFRQFENFGQDFLVKENLKGTAKAMVEFYSPLDAHLNFDQKKLRSTIDITLDNGELIELNSMSQIAAYVRSNPLVAPFVNEDKLEEKLRHIYFSQITNSIEIKDERITIPHMSIYSSAMDITVEGVHFFNNNIDYTMGFKIRDLLAKDNQTEFGEVQDDGLSNSFFLSMKGNTDNPEFGYDRLAHKEKRKEDRQKEKEVFKQLIREEIGLDEKSDSTSTQQQEPEVTITVDGNKKEKKKKRWFDDDDDEEDEQIIPDDDDDDF